MANFDIVLLVVILLSAFIGLSRGLFKEVISLASWIAAVALAIYFSPRVGEMLGLDMGGDSGGLVLGFLIIFIGTLIVGGLVQWLVGKMVQTTGLSGTDRFLGFLFGSARGILVCLVVLIALRNFAENTDWWQASRIAPQLLAFEEDVLQLFGRAKDGAAQVTEQLDSIR